MEGLVEGLMEEPHGGAGGGGPWRGWWRGPWRSWWRGPMEGLVEGDGKIGNVSD